MTSSCRASIHMSFFFRNFLLLLPTLDTLTQNSHTVVSPASRNPLPQRRAGKPSAYSRSKEGLRENRCLDPPALTQPAAPGPACHRPSCSGTSARPLPRAQSQHGEAKWFPPSQASPPDPQLPQRPRGLSGVAWSPDSHQHWPIPLLQFHQNGPL